jgi:hypothetical protein
MSGITLEKTRTKLIELSYFLFHSVKGQNWKNTDIEMKEKISKKILLKENRSL